MNPFTNRGAITNADDFFGRTEQLTEILTRLQRMQSSSVVGERRIGKSSLLNYLTKKGVEKIADENYRFLYVDMMDARVFTANGFFRHILKELGIGDGLIRDEKTPDRNLCAFTDGLEDLAKQGKRVVLCLDEFENAFDHPKEFSNDFFDHMRSQINQGKFAMVTSSRKMLRDLCAQGKLTSPFYNVFTPIPLGLFTEEEANLFINTHHQHVNFSEQELTFVRSYIEPHPMKMQIRCDWVIRNRQKGLSEWALTGEINKETESFFDRKVEPRKLTQYLSVDWFAKLLKSLKDARDLITGK